MFTRRTMLAAGPAAAGMTTLAQAQTGAAAPAAAAGSPQAPGFYRYKVGDIEVTAINDGFAMRPLEGFIRDVDLADVKKVATENFMPETSIPNFFTTTVLRTGGRTVLIDTGFADNGPPTTGRWMTNFRTAGFDPAEVSAVIISHFHGDHINGLRLKDGTAVFPNAEVMVPEAEWAFWMDDAKMAAAPEAGRAGFMAARRVFGPMAKDVKRYEAGKELVPGVTAVATHGHSPGHTSHLVSSGGKSLMVAGDFSTVPAFFVKNPAWSPIFDMDANMARATRTRMLDMLASERTPVAFYHAPFPAVGHIAREGSGLRYAPIHWSPAV